MQNNCKKTPSYDAGNGAGIYLLHSFYVREKVD